MSGLGKKRPGALPPSQRPPVYRHARVTFRDARFRPPVRRLADAVVVDDPFVLGGPGAQISRVTSGEVEWADATLESVKRNVLALLERVRPPAPTASTFDELRSRIRIQHVGGVWLEWRTSDEHGRPLSSEAIAMVRPAMRIVERESGNVSALYGAPVVVHRGKPIAEVAQLVRASVKELLSHEVDEQLIVDGERMFDPHPPPPAFTLTVGPGLDGAP